MPKGFYTGRLQPASHRVVETEARRPLFCVLLSVTVTVILATVFAVSAWNLRRNQFEPDLMNFHAGDEVAASKVCSDFSSIFCDSYEISLWQAASVYVLPHRADVNLSDVTNHPFTLRQSPNKFLDTREYYLLQGSSIVFDACRQNGSRSRADVYIIRGNSNFNDFLNLGRCADDCLLHTTIPHDAICQDDLATSGLVHMDLTANTTDTYYIITTYSRVDNRPHHRSDPGVILNGTLSRTHYSVSRHEKICRAPRDKHCSFPVPWNSDTDVVVKFAGDAHSDTMQTAFNSKCHFRVIFWLCLFAGTPFVISTAASVFFGCLFCRERRRNFASVQRTAKRKAKRRVKKSDKNELVENEVIAEDGGVMAIQDD